MLLLTWLAVGAGSLLRLFHWADNRALWRDELYLAASLVRRGFWELATGPLAYEQKAPLGFLWAERLAVELLGKGEMALRLFPLLCGLAALAAFVPVARHFLRPWAAALAVGLLALASPAVYHAVEAKQYSTELLASVLALLLYVRLPARPGARALLGWGLAGALLLWFSYSAVFALAGTGLAAGLGALRRGGWRRSLPYALPAALWLCSFAAVYALFLGRYQDSRWLTVFFEKVYSAYMPLPPSSAEDLTWFLHKVNALIKHPLGQKMRFTGSLSFLFVQFRLMSLLLLGTGLVFMPRKDFQKYLVLVFPILLTLLASGLQLYPFHERFVLFLAPMFLLLIGYGAQVLQEVFPEKLPVKLAVSLLLLAAPVWNAISEIRNTDNFYKKEANREALLYINEQFKAGDVVYVYWNMWHAYEYYKEAYKLKFTAVEGKDLKESSGNQHEYLQNLSPAFNQFQGKKRLWFLYHTHVRNNIGGFVGQPAWYFDKAFVPGLTLEATFSKMGAKQQEQFEEKETVVSLFQLNP
ncbi:glycosyltransferase family 39 protein [Rufibacter sediminis]